MATQATKATPTQDRPVNATYDRKGNPEWKSPMSPPDNSAAVVSMVPDRIIPVIFVPGVMGSNLTCADEETRWLLDGAGTMLKSWRTVDAKGRKKLLVPDKCKVYDGGVLPEGTAQSDEELKRRGWGEVGAMSYGPFLAWLEHELNNFDNAGNGQRSALIAKLLGAQGEVAITRDEVGLSYRYRLPVYACGYNWLQDNAVSAERLAQRISEIRARYIRDKKMCDQVILVTHSMGGFVARYCVEHIAGMKEKVMGVVHGVMPTIGSGAVYRRMKAGTESDGSFAGKQTAEILGGDAAEMTAVLSEAAGPLQLLPTPEYGADWLKVMDGDRVVLSLPKADGPGGIDPYSQIYASRGQWWSMCEEDLINPLKPNHPEGSAEQKAQLDDDWLKFSTQMRNVKVFHQKTKDTYHPCSYAFYGDSDSFKAFGTVTWRRSGRIKPNQPDADPLQGLPLKGQLEDTRTVTTPVKDPTSYARFQIQHFTLAGPDEPGDGTVPRRSGVALKARMNATLKVSVGHEPAYKDSEAARQFTLQSIVHIAQGVAKTPLAYPESK